MQVDAQTYQSKSNGFAYYWQEHNGPRHSEYWLHIYLVPQNSPEGTGCAVKAPGGELQTDSQVGTKDPYEDVGEGID